MYKRQVCNRLLNNPIDVRESRVAEPKRDAKPFNLSDYDILRFNPREKDTQRKHYPYFKERGINMGTQFAFHKHFFLATRRRNDVLSFANLAFPLSLPSKPDSIVGLEEREHLFFGILPGLHGLLPRFDFFLKGIQFFQTCTKLFFFFI